MPRRTTATITVSVSPEELKKVERLARQENKSKSQLFRDMLAGYEEEKQALALEELVKYGRQTAKRLGVKSDADIEKLVHEARGVHE
jgi:predicted transcriptional regulator